MCQVEVDVTGREDDTGNRDGAVEVNVADEGEVAGQCRNGAGGCKLPGSRWRWWRETAQKRGAHWEGT